MDTVIWMGVNGWKRRYLRVLPIAVLPLELNSFSFPLCMFGGCDWWKGAGEERIWNAFDGPMRTCR